jgi:hypothetical protein
MITQKAQIAPVSRNQFMEKTTSYKIYDAIASNERL